MIATTSQLTVRPHRTAPPLTRLGCFWGGAVEQISLCEVQYRGAVSLLLSF